jgi:hydrogenase expression/formation protein HypE
LAMCGARPRWLSAGFIMEEGLPMETLRRVVASMRVAAEQCGVKIVTGDTKVVERGKADGLYVTTAGIGVIERGPGFFPASIEDGDAVILSGDVGRHGMAIMASREGLAFESTIESDCGSLAGAVMALLDAGATVHCARDLTRGGLATALVELAEASGRDFRIREESIGVTEQVRAACEILGLDPLYVANEGRMVCFVPAAQAGLACDAIRSARPECVPIQIGTVHAGHGRVALRSLVGVDRLLERLSGEQLPRIC